MSKTVVAVGGVIPSALVNALNNPSYSHDPQEDGQLPYPSLEGLGVNSAISAERERAEEAEQGIGQALSEFIEAQTQINSDTATSVTSLAERVASVITLPRSGEDTFQWSYLGAFYPSDDDVFGGRSPHSLVRYADGLLSISFQIGLKRDTLPSWNIIAPVELVISIPGNSLSPLLAYLQDTAGLMFTASLRFAYSDARIVAAHLSAGTIGSNTFIRLHLRHISPNSMAYTYGDLLADLDFDRDGDSADNVVLNIHESFVVPQP